MRTPRRVRVLASQAELLLALIHKDFDARYAGSVLGICWTQIYPLLLLAVYTFVFSVIFKNTIPNFPLFLFVGIALWAFFSNAIQLSTGSIIANANLVRKVGFPRETLTMSVVGVALIDLLASHVVLAVGAMIFGIAPAWSWFALPLIVGLFAVQCLGFGLILATVAVYFRDIRFFVEVGVLLLMFLSPVFYSETAVPESLSWVMKINPIAVAISSYRMAFMEGTWPPMSSWTMLTCVAIVALIVGLEVFDRGQRGFSDVV
jgi:ABC-type polysaccharide/polyol phosphate export permease